MEPIIFIAVIGALGIGSQWLAWRLQMPAIVLMLAAGLIAGPGLRIIDPAADLGELFRPIISVAVAIILFEGGLTLNFAELKQSGTAVRRLVYLGAPLAWIFSTAALHLGAGLSLEASAVFGGILIVTGPTVIFPLLRQARLAQRPAAILRWESIVNDAVGALAAVLAYEIVHAIYGSGSIGEAAQHFGIGIALAAIVGYAAGRFTVFAFARGHVPEYMKVPVLLALVLGAYALTDTVLHESGLLAVTIMGIVIANSHLPSFVELRRFKEHMTVILVSGVFVMLAASLNREMIATLDWRALVFVTLVIFVARPLAVWLSLIGTDLSREERAIVAWIGPRGVVAVAVAGLFGTRLAELGIEDGAALAPLAFALVAATVVIHGFSMAPLARALGLTSRQPPGVLIAGASDWSVDLASVIRDAGVPVLMADWNFFKLRGARQADLPIFHGEILSEAAEHSVPLSHFGSLIAATQNDAYNALICTDFGPEFGRGNVFQIGRHAPGEGARDLPVTLGGRVLGSALAYEDFVRRYDDGWRFAVTGLTDEYGLDDYRSDNPDVEIVGVIGKDGALALVTNAAPVTAGDGDQILAFRMRKG